MFTKQRIIRFFSSSCIAIAVVSDGYFEKGKKGSHSAEERDVELEKKLSRDDTLTVRNFLRARPQIQV